MKGGRIALAHHGLAGRPLYSALMRTRVVDVSIAASMKWDDEIGTSRIRAPLGRMGDWRMR